MAIQLKRKIVCSNCGGTGRENGDPCEQCGGEGNISAYGLLGQMRALISVVQDEIVAHSILIPGVISTYKILEATDGGEYLALNADQKALYALFISAGTLDMVNGAHARFVFLDYLFPPGTVSHSAILGII